MPKKTVPDRQCRFRQALAEETGNDVLRWATIEAEARRLRIDPRVAILLAAECAEAAYVRLDAKGPPYLRLPGAALLTEEGRQLVKSSGSSLVKDATKGRKPRRSVARSAGASRSGGGSQGKR